MNKCIKDIKGVKERRWLPVRASTYNELVALYHEKWHDWGHALEAAVSARAMLDVANQDRRDAEAEIFDLRRQVDDLVHEAKRAHKLAGKLAARKLAEGK